MKRFAVWFSLVALAAAMAPGVVVKLRAQGATTVALDVFVEDRGEAVAGLTAQSFRVYENGEARKVVRAEPAGPASIVILVENSLHSWRFLNDVRSAMRGFLKAVPEGAGHSYALVTYEQQPVVEESLTQEIGRIEAAFADVKQSAWGRTDTYDAIYRVVDEMETLPGRRVLLFVGFGYDAFSRHTLGELQRKIEASNLQVYGVATGSDLRRLQQIYPDRPEPLDLRHGEMLIRMMARRSGGKWFCPSCEADYIDSMRDTMATIDRQYRIEYERGEALDPGFYKLKIEAFRIVGDVRTDFKVLARDGWRVENAGR